VGEELTMETLSEAFLERKVEEVDFLRVIQHLNFGGAVFITHRRRVTSTEERIYEFAHVGGEIQDSSYTHEYSRSLGTLEQY